MKFKLLAVASAIALAGPASAGIVYSWTPDDHPTLYQNDGHNYAPELTWANQVVLGSTTTITGMDIFSNFIHGVVGQSVTIRIWTGDPSPTAFLTQFNDLLDAVDTDGTAAFNAGHLPSQAMNRKYSQFDVPITLAAGSYWFSMSGTFVEMNQGVSSGGGNTSIFDGAHNLVYQYGDLNSYMRLYSNATATPEPGMVGLMGLGFMGLAGLQRRRRKTA